ncbi:YbhB/YbcL family Raf kinase inhibitor-like protein [Ruminococcus flavefaciens]|uniref:YbhB/YbcL family Raf kinase inhibitor-like protein n=1 Tax=Ruminococcus flavefaciens TaxID=1265 RepID=UPI00048C2F4B|nr:hypothetical protein [Ruminococcus flavefaciens]
MKLRKNALILCFSLAVFAVTGCGESKKDVEKDVSADTKTTTILQDTTEVALTTEAETAAEVTTKAEEAAFLDGLTAFDVTSENLHDGVWDSVISNTSSGDNHSPQLSWESVENAECYVIYMIDTSAGNWLHWKSNNVTLTELPEGWAGESEYVGPYPPKGAPHDYEIYVLALKKPFDEIKGWFDNTNNKFFENMELLDTDADGESGNIISYGHITGTFTYIG